MKLRPIVKFKFITDLSGRDFQEHFCSIFADFFESISVSDSNKSEAKALRGGYHHHSFNGNEDGIGCFCIGKEFIPHCKAHFFDGVSRGEYCTIPKWEELFCGVIFRNHSEPTRLAEEVFLLAYSFEKFLRERSIQFERYNFDDKNGYFLAKHEHDPAQ